MSRAPQIGDQRKRHFGQRFVESMRGTQLSTRAKENPPAPERSARVHYPQRHRSNLSLAGYAPFSPYSGDQRSPKTAHRDYPSPQEFRRPSSSPTARRAVDFAEGSAGSREGTPTRSRQPRLSSSISCNEGYLMSTASSREKSPKLMMRLADRQKNDQTERTTDCEPRGRRKYPENTTRTTSPIVQESCGYSRNQSPMSERGRSADPRALNGNTGSGSTPRARSVGKRHISVESNRSIGLDSFGDPEDRPGRIVKKVPEPMTHRKKYIPGKRPLYPPASETMDLVSMGADNKPIPLTKIPWPAEPLHRPEGREAALAVTTKRHYGREDQFNQQHFGVGRGDSVGRYRARSASAQRSDSPKGRRGCTPQGRNYDIISQFGYSNLSPVKGRRVVAPPSSRGIPVHPAGAERRGRSASLYQSPSTVGAVGTRGRSNRSSSPNILAWN